jgi:hypothetical protein
MGKGPRNIIKTARLETSDIALEIFIDDWIDKMLNKKLIPYFVANEV